MALFRQDMITLQEDRGVENWFTTLLSWAGKKKKKNYPFDQTSPRCILSVGWIFSIYKEACLQLESVLILTDDGNDFSTTVKCKWEMMKKFNRNIIIAVSSQPQLAIDCYSLYQIYSSFIVCFLSNESFMLWCWGMQQEINPGFFLVFFSCDGTL